MIETRPFLACGGRASQADLSALCHAGTVIEQKKQTGAAKVISVSDPNRGDLIIKVWHPKRLITSARLNPYDIRFRNNAVKLRRLGFQTPVVLGWGSIGRDGTRFLCYEALPGRTLRELQPDVDLTGAAAFIVRLHDTGVDFRSLHLGNILWDGANGYSLIDLTDCRFSTRSLSLKRRANRLLYLCTHKRDVAFMASQNHWSAFLAAYCDAAGAEPSELRRHACRHPRWASLTSAAMQPN